MNNNGVEIIEVIIILFSMFLGVCGCLLYQKYVPVNDCSKVEKYTYVESISTPNIKGLWAHKERYRHMDDPNMRYRIHSIKPYVAINCIESSDNILHLMCVDEFFKEYELVSK